MTTSFVRIALAGVAIVLVAGLAMAAEAPALFSNDANDYVMPEANDYYNAQVRDAVTKRAGGDFKGALASFENAASGGMIAEIPNYMVWIDMADLYCKLGNVKAGQAMLGEYDCAVEILAGHKMCSLSRQPSFQIPARGVSPLCYAQICNGFFDDSIGQDNPELRARYKRKRAMIAAVRAECSAQKTAHKPG